MKRESLQVASEGLSRIDVGEPETQNSKGLQGWLWGGAEKPELTFKGLVDT